jgi:hypothetical protein
VGQLEHEKAAATNKIDGLEKELSSTRQILLNQQQLYQKPPAPSTYQSIPDPPMAPLSSYQSKPTGLPSASDFRATLPIPERTLDSTMKNIVDARAKVAHLQEHVERVRHLTEGSAANHMLSSLNPSMPEQKEMSEYEHAASKSSLDTRLWETAQAIRNKTTSTSPKRVELMDPMSAFDDIMQKHSKKILDESYSPKPKCDVPSQQMAWERPDFHSSQSSQTRDSRKSAEEKQPDAQGQMKKLQQEILTEREIRRGNDTNPEVIKEKVLEKIKSSSMKGKKVLVSSHDRSWFPLGKRVKNLDRNPISKKIHFPLKHMLGSELRLKFRQYQRSLHRMIVAVKCLL